MAERFGCKGLLLDMDNTLLQSRIDYRAMKLDVYRFLRSRGIVGEEVQADSHTTSTLIAEAIGRGLAGESLDLVWSIAAKHEIAGMKDAGLEPGAAAFLADLPGGIVKAVVTNNAYEAAVRALEQTGILGMIDIVAGREMMSSLKPSPSGYRYVMERYADIVPMQWIAVGDSWIDGKAAEEAGVPFIGYRIEPGLFAARSVVPAAIVESFEELGRLLKPEAGQEPY